MILAEQFLKSISLGYKEKVLCKLDKFEKELLACQNKIRELTSGYWVRRIKNTDVFKFRLNNKDRILFTFITERECYETSCILFLKCVNHDEQIRVGSNMKFDNIEIDETNYEDTDLIEKNIEDDINLRVLISKFL